MKVFDWSQFTPIDADGLAGELMHDAETLNRRMADLETFRAKADAAEPIAIRARPGTVHDEAMRREVVLRTDIMRFEQATKRDTSANLALLGAANQILTDRGTHTTAGAL